MSDSSRQGDQTPTYDDNGNAMFDSYHIYTWGPGNVT
jgi:hypothetical protein